MVRVDEDFFVVMGYCFFLVCLVGLVDIVFFMVDVLVGFICGLSGFSNLNL